MARESNVAWEDHEPWGVRAAYGVGHSASRRRPQLLLCADQRPLARPFEFRASTIYGAFRVGQWPSERERAPLVRQVTLRRVHPLEKPTGPGCEHGRTLRRVMDILRFGSPMAELLSVTLWSAARCRLKSLSF